MEPFAKSQNLAFLEITNILGAINRKSHELSPWQKTPYRSSRLEKLEHFAWQQPKSEVSWFWLDQMSLELHDLENRNIPMDGSRSLNGATIHLKGWCVFLFDNFVGNCCQISSLQKYVFINKDINGIQVAYDVANKEFRPAIPSNTPSEFKVLTERCW